ncbi:helix-turn-helix transcriptional regulator [Leucobacter iarius]|uniref:YafY family protein n=1 Tax=Leucobacter iarius TaxID=333963 RepID=A0ABP4XVM8_9MICO
MERPQRLLAILVALQANRRMTAGELAEQFAVSRRTVLRDIDALAAADVPIVAERGRYGGISLLPGADVDVSRFTSSESEALELVGVDLAQARRLGLEAAARSAAQKLTARKRWQRPGTDPQRLPLARVVAIDSGGWFVPEEHADVAALVRDLRLGARLRITYRSSGRPAASERTVDPHGLFSRGGRWYLIAEADGDPRMFALARLETWTVLPETRRLRSELPLEALATSLVAGLEQRRSLRVTALLDAGTEDLARRILGSRLEAVDPTSDPDTVRITVGYDQLDAVRQLLQFSDHLEVVDPPEARRLVAALAEGIARRHSGERARSQPLPRSVGPNESTNALSLLTPPSGDVGTTRTHHPTTEEHAP